MSGFHLEQDVDTDLLICPHLSVQLHGPSGVHGPAACRAPAQLQPRHHGRVQ